MNIYHIFLVTLGLFFIVMEIYIIFSARTESDNLGAICAFVFFFMIFVNIDKELSPVYDQIEPKKHPQINMNNKVKYPFRENVCQLKKEIDQAEKTLIQDEKSFEKAIETRTGQISAYMDVMMGRHHLADLISRYNKLQLHYNGFLIGTPIFEKLLL
ncbi:hypothetical protein KKC45_00240 [Patescibacteria group bacterium]|nr:hypothetical protein [Patescibacteria group bacterium]